MQNLQWAGDVEHEVQAALGVPFTLRVKRPRTRNTDLVSLRDVLLINLAENVGIRIGLEITSYYKACKHIQILRNSNYKNKTLSKTKCKIYTTPSVSANRPTGRQHLYYY